MQLIIEKCILRANLIRVLRLLKPDLSLKECIELVNNLPYEEECYYNIDWLKSLLEGNCIYSYKEIDYSIRYGQCCIIESFDLQQQNQEYIDANEWYKSLSDENRHNVDVLVKHYAIIA